MAYARAAVFLLALGALLALYGCGDGGSGAGERPCKNGIVWSDADDHVGEERAVRGTVRGVLYALALPGSPTFINIGEPFPSKDRVEVKILGKDRKNFPRPPEDAYVDKLIAVTGEITTEEDTPQVAVEGPSAIVVC